MTFPWPFSCLQWHWKVTSFIHSIIGWFIHWLIYSITKHLLHSVLWARHWVCKTILGNRYHMMQVLIRATVDGTNHRKYQSPEDRNIPVGCPQPDCTEANLKGLRTCFLPVVDRDSLQSWTLGTISVGTTPEFMSPRTSEPLILLPHQYHHADP